MLDPMPNGALVLAPSLTDQDRAIIAALQEDGRRSFSQIATDLGISERTVRQEVGRLRDDGVIRITTVADPHLYGYRMIALVGIRVRGGHAVSDIVRQLFALPGAFYVGAVTGRYNIVAELTCHSTDELLATLDGGLGVIGGIADYEVHPYLRLSYHDPAFGFSHTTGKVDANEAFRGVDEIDRSIIRLLSVDGRTAFQGIARELEVSESQVRQRVKRLTASGALRIMALTIPRGIGLETLAIVGITVESGANAEVIAGQLAALPSVIYVALCAGRYEIFAEVACVDAPALLQFLNQQIRSLHGVRDAEPWIYLDLLYRPVTPV